MRRRAVLRSRNFLTGLMPGSWFQIATSRDMGQSLVAERNSFSVANRIAPPLFRAFSLEAYTLAQLAESMTNVFIMFSPRRFPETWYFPKLLRRVDSSLRSPGQSSRICAAFRGICSGSGPGIARAPSGAKKRQRAGSGTPMESSFMPALMGFRASSSSSR